ncbi:MAG: glycosyltransferase family 4 protein [Acidobacteriaceae bacterium]
MTYTLATDRPLRVGIDVRWNNDSGVGTYIRNLINSLLELDDRIEYVFYLKESDGMFWDAGCKRVRARRVRIPKYSFKEQLIFPRLAAEDRLDVFHIPFYVAPLSYSGKTVVTLYDVEQLLFRHCAPRWPGQMLIHLMMKLTVRKADRIIAISENTKRDLVDVLGANPAKIESILIACSPIFVAGSPKSKFGDLAERLRISRPFVVAYVGKQWKLKNTEAALLGFLRAKREFNLPHQLVLVGRMGPDGEAFWESEPMVRNRESIIRTGFVPDEDLVALYSAAEAFVFPSRYEGFGLPPLEAMACGAPVIASPHGSLREVLGDAAIYVEPDDIRQIGAAIARVATDPELRERLSCLGRTRARVYSWRETALRTAEIYWKAAERTLASTAPALR